MAVASIGLCYSTDTAEKWPLMVPGSEVFIPNLSSIQAGNIVNETSASDNIEAQQFMVNK